MQLCEASVLWCWPHNHAALLLLRRWADRVHKRSCSREFMICSYWGDAHIYQGGKYFTSLYGVRPLWATGGVCVCFLSMEKQCVPRKSPTPINHSLPLQLWVQVLVWSESILFDCVYSQPEREKTHVPSAVIGKKCHKSSYLSLYIFKAECGLRVWAVAVAQGESGSLVEITPTGREVWTVLGAIKPEICHRMRTLLWLKQVISSGSLKIT